MNKTDSVKMEIKGEEENNSCFRIIALGGDAKSKVKEAMVKIKEKNYSDASDLMRLAGENIMEGRKIQHELLTRDIRGNNISMSAVLLNHAMDILITAETELSMLDFIFHLINDKQLK